MNSFRRRLMMVQGESFILKPCVYKTTTSNEMVALFGDSSSIKRAYLEDGTEISINESGTIYYTFKNSGYHNVYIELKEDATNLNYLFAFCYKLVSVPENLFYKLINVTSARSCFVSCKNLEDIPKKIFSKNKKIENFETCFTSSKITKTPKDEDGGELWEREGKEGYPATIRGRECFRHCENLENYDSIPDDWK